MKVPLLAEGRVDLFLGVGLQVEQVESLQADRRIVNDVGKRWIWAVSGRCLPGCVWSMTMLPVMKTES